MIARLPFVVCLASLALFATGCPRSDVTTEDGPPEVVPDDHADHDHHDHGEHGPHGGALVHLEPSGAHAEWVDHDEEDTLRVYVLDDPEAVTAVEMTVAVSGEEPKVFAFEPAEDGEAGAYEIQSGELLVAIGMREAADVTLTVTSGDESSSASVEPHDHDH